MTAVRGLLGLTITMASVCAVASCSLIVQFHDQPASGDASAAVDGDMVPLDSGSPGDPDGAIADVFVDDVVPHPKEAGPAPDHYAPCSGLVSGYYCANDGPHAFAGPSNDLLFCDDGGIGKATPCDGGCLDLPAPFPDACNPCPGVADGVYCGRDLAGFPADNADFLIQCQSGNTSQSYACPHGCDSEGKMSACYP
jgi:hypothetical protein